MPTVYIFPQQFFAILDTLFPKVRTFFPFIISSGIAPAKFEGLRCDDASIATRNLIIHAFRYERFEAPGVTSIPIKLMRKAYNGLYEIASMGVTALPAGFEGKSRLYQHVGKNVALPAVAIHRKPSVRLARLGKTSLPPLDPVVNQLSEYHESSLGLILCVGIMNGMESLMTEKRCKNISCRTFVSIPAARWLSLTFLQIWEEGPTGNEEILFALCWVPRVLLL